MYGHNSECNSSLTYKEQHDGVHVEHNFLANIFYEIRQFQVYMIFNM